MKRILACVSAAPSSRNVILKAAEIAKQMSARLVAAHVRRDSFSPRARRRHTDQHEEVERHLSLARELGAEVAILSGNDVAATIIEFAELSRVSRIVVGKDEHALSGRTRRRKDVTQRLILGTTQIEVLVVPGDPSDYGPHHRSRVHRIDELRRFPRDLLVSGGLIGAAALVSSFLHTVGFADANIVMVFLGAVLGTTFIAGRLQGIIASMMGVLTFNFLFTEPRFTLVVYDTQYILTFAVMLLVALTTSELLSRVRLQAVISRRRADRTAAVYRLSRALLTVSGEVAVIEEALDQLVRYYGGTALWYEGDPGSNVTPLIKMAHSKAAAQRGEHNVTEREREAAAWVYKNGRTTGVGLEPFADSTLFFAPLLSGAGVLGVLGVSIGASVEGSSTAEQRTLIETFAGQVALALERERFARRHEQAKIEVEAERLKNHLLRSISHDLRTPLAGIAGSAAVLLELKGAAADGQISELAGDIHEQATWLNGLVENLLSLTRIESGSPSIAFQSETVDDLIGSVLGRMRRRLAPFRINTSMPKSVVVVPMDARLIEQVLMNLFDNACRHSPPGSDIGLTVSVNSEEVTFAVADSGPGFSKQDLDHLFEKFYTGAEHEADVGRGVGLGLTICQAIIHTHGGAIDARNADGRGAEVRFTLPLRRSAQGGKSTDEQRISK